MISPRTLFHQLHIWLGLLSGLVVFIVAITGCMYAFQAEIKAVTQPYQFVQMEERPFLSPETLKGKALPLVYTAPADSSNVIYGVTYGTREMAAVMAYNHYADGYTLLFLNPYSGKCQGKQILKNDFFRRVLAGHRMLWLPPAIGRPIVGWSVVVFVVVLLTGFALWLPKRFRKKSLLNALQVKGKPGTFRFVYDLHKVLGGYVLCLSLLVALTGLTWSFKWFSESYYRLLSGGKEMKRWEVAQSDTTKTASVSNPGEWLWQQMTATYPIGQTGTFMFDFPATGTDAFRICYNPANNGTYYKRQFRFFDRNTLDELPGGGIYGISHEEAGTADKIYRMTYDIHVGAIGGIAGKIILFFVSLIIASLPVTGVMIFLKKRKKK